MRSVCGRSLGDSMAEGVGVFAEPEQLVLNVTKDDRFIVIASDGVFEFITSHQVCGRCILQSLTKKLSIYSRRIIIPR